MYLCIFDNHICILDRVTRVSYAPAACARAAFDDGHQFFLDLN